MDLSATTRSLHKEMTLTMFIQVVNEFRNLRDHFFYSYSVIVNSFYDELYEIKNCSV